MTTIADPNAPPADPIELVEPGSLMTSVSFSADGQRLAVLSDAHTVRLWDMTANNFSGQPVELVSRAKPSNRLPSARMGGGFLAGLRNGALQRSWRAQDLIDLACLTAGRNLTLVEWKRYFEEMSITVLHALNGQQVIEKTLSLKRANNHHHQRPRRPSVDLRNLAEEAGFDVRVFPSQRADKYRRHIPAASAAPAAGTGG